MPKYAKLWSSIFRFVIFAVLGALWLMRSLFGKNA